MTGMVSEITGFSTRDGPGIRTSVFLKGCPLRCKWCSNPETFVSKKQLYYIPRKCTRCNRCITACPQGAISTRYSHSQRIDRKRCDGCLACCHACLSGAFQEVGKEFTPEELCALVCRDKAFFGAEGGVTLSGGEPLFQADFAIEFFSLCKQNGIHTALDTCAYGDTQSLQTLLRYTDMALLDIKHMDSAAHKTLTGVANERIHHNARIICATVPTRISLPLIGGANDAKSNLEATARFAVENKVEWIDINPVHFLGMGKYRYLGMQQPYGKFRQFKKEELLEITALFHGFGLQTTIGRMM